MVNVEGEMAPCGMVRASDERTVDVLGSVEDLSKADERLASQK